MEAKLRILIIDDEPAILSALRRLLRGHEVVVYDSAQAALTYLRDQDNPRPDLILTDTNMPQMSGPKFLAAVLAERLAPNAYRVIMSGDDEEVAQAAIKAGLAAEFLSKPFECNQLEQIIMMAMLAIA